MPTAREALLDAALRALADRPWRTVRMVDVAALAGVSRQTLYNEFGTKGGLATALLTQAADSYLTGVDRALTAPAPEHPAAVAFWTVRAAREDPLVKGLLTGLWEEGLPRPGRDVPGPARLLGLARDRMAAASLPVAGPASAAEPDSTAEPDSAEAASRAAERSELVLRLALSCVIVPCRDRSCPAHRAAATTGEQGLTSSLVEALGSGAPMSTHGRGTAMRTLVLGRTPARVTAVLATLRADGFDAQGVSTDEEALTLLRTGEFGVLIIGGGVGPGSRAAIRAFAAEHRVRRVIDGALREPFDTYVRNEFEPLIREAASQG